MMYGLGATRSSSLDTNATAAANSKGDAGRETREKEDLKVPASKAYVCSSNSASDITKLDS